MQPFAIMQNTICYYAKYHLLSCNISFASCNISFASWDIPFAIMQIILCYHAGYPMLLCGVLTFYHNYYQPSRLTYYYQVIIITSLGALPFDLTGTYNSAIRVWIGMARFFMIEIIIFWYRLMKATIIYLTTATSSGIYIIIILRQQYLSICCRIKLQ